ncbi:MAG: hypothetical protein HY826_09380 [Actinobacteria bacterium]|nr:hypothetical protein [Actinomycetota bacterium]
MSIVAPAVIVVFVAVVVGLGHYLGERSTESVAERRARRRRMMMVSAIGLVAAVAALVVGLVVSPTPGRSPTPLSSAPKVVTVNVIEGSRIAEITLDPAVSGGTAVHVYITSAGGSFEEPSEIRVTAELPLQQVGPIELPVEVAGRGHVSGSDVDLPMPGLWTITVIATYGDADVTTFATEIEVR